MSFDPVHNFNHWLISMILAGMTGLIITYLFVTVMCWSVDYPDNHMTLVQYIYSEQIQYVWLMLHKVL